MREHHGRAADAAVLLRERLEQLTSQLSELESLRARVLEAERSALITADSDPLWLPSFGAASARQAVRYRVRRRKWNERISGDQLAHPLR